MSARREITSSGVTHAKDICDELGGFDSGQSAIDGGQNHFNGHADKVLNTGGSITEDNFDLVDDGGNGVGGRVTGVEELCETYY